MDEITFDLCMTKTESSTLTTFTIRMEITKLMKCINSLVWKSL